MTIKGSPGQNKLIEVAEDAYKKNFAAKIEGYFLSKKLSKFEYTLFLTRWPYTELLRYYWTVFLKWNSFSHNTAAFKINLRYKTLKGTIYTAL